MNVVARGTMSNDVSSAAYMQVSCDVTSYFSGSDDRSQPVRSDAYWIGIRVSPSSSTDSAAVAATAALRVGC